MLKKYARKNFKVFICLLIVTAMTSCTILRPPESKEDDSDKKKNPPKSLTQMEEQTDGIILGIEDVQQKRAQQIREEKHPSNESKPETQEGGPKPQSSGLQMSQEQSQGQEQGQEEGEQQANQGQQQNQQESRQESAPTQQPESTAKPIPEPDWNELEFTIETIHEQWNSYEPYANSDGAMNETISNFEKQLISLTEQIMARNEEKTLTAANTLYSYFSDFLKLYAHNQPPEITELRGLARQIIQYGQQEKWIETKPLLEKMKESWQDAKTKMKKPDQMLNSKIEAALSDFQYVVNEKKINLARIKGNILIKNLDQVE
ncbi:MAG: hypothetical protein GX783_10030 [Clostridiales bacterium]|nr:hypothetical protein [Clostridiales bacterium]